MAWNLDLDLDRMRADYAADRRVIIDRAVVTDAAHQIVEGLDDLSARGLWFRAVRGDPHLAPSAPNDPGTTFRYQFDKYPLSHVPLATMFDPMIGDSRRSGPDPVVDESGQLAELPAEHPLTLTAAFLNSPACASGVSAITGLAIPPGACVSYATRYMAGDFLSVHDDEVPSDDRAVAFVLQLAPRWIDDWGAHTLFYERLGADRATAVMNRFNQLVLFGVPVAHSVSPVAAHCSEPRYAISGWFHHTPR